MSPRMNPSSGVAPALPLAEIIRRYAELMAENGVIPARDYHLPSVALVGMFNELIAEWLTENTGLSAAEMARRPEALGWKLTGTAAAGGRRATRASRWRCAAAARRKQNLFTGCE